MYKNMNNFEFGVTLYFSVNNYNFLTTFIKAPFLSVIFLSVIIKLRNALKKVVTNIYT